MLVFDGHILDSFVLIFSTVHYRVLILYFRLLLHIVEKPPNIKTIIVLVHENSFEVKFLRENSCSVPDFIGLSLERRVFLELLRTT